nr:hypothetical ORF-1A protein - Leishmania tarentolae mitochondrion [Leishmania tarentolae]
IKLNSKESFRKEGSDQEDQRGFGNQRFDLGERSRRVKFCPRAFFRAGEELDRPRKRSFSEGFEQANILTFLPTCTGGSQKSAPKV